MLTPHPQSLISEFSLTEIITELSPVVTSTEELVKAPDSIGIPYHLREPSDRVAVAESVGVLSVTHGNPSLEEISYCPISVSRVRNSVQY